MVSIFGAINSISTFLALGVIFGKFKPFEDFYPNQPIWLISLLEIHRSRNDDGPQNPGTMFSLLCITTDNKSDLTRLLGLKNDARCVVEDAAHHWSLPQIRKTRRLTGNTLS
jgi:hypothetical protein